ncbi:transcriptional regulator, tetr family [hydrocarbon metagenome]|uniref:Transcriptional regulator, tetr family n=1 Tax=hydrocarbon metagenome TaxID=938273 RepID=A0A0W8E2T5_9ZZZZ
MEKKRYHHGNLKECLIEAGIDLINKEGEKHFSLRKVAALCGVSNAAPYSHFKSKEELLITMQNYVTDQFTAELKKSIKGEDLDSPTAIIKLGKSYVMFFIRNPQYFEFLFSQSFVRVNLNLNDDGSNNYPPFELLRKTTFRVLGKMGMPKEKIKDTVISEWATVHGLAAIATMEGISYDYDWEQKIEDIIVHK